MDHSVYIYKTKIIFSFIDINCFNKKRDEYMTSMSNGIVEF